MAIAEDDGWIPCYKEKPPRGISLLVTFEMGSYRYVDKACYDESVESEKAWMILSHLEDSERVRIPAEKGTHWRRIPEPAKSVFWWKEDNQ